MDIKAYLLLCCFCIHSSFPFVWLVCANGESDTANWLCTDWLTWGEVDLSLSSVLVSDTYYAVN